MMKTGRIALQAKAVCIGALAVLGIADRAQAQQADSEVIAVVMDQAKLVKLPAGADTIVIGNPSIADVTVQKNGVMIITGRSAGRTNFIALNQSGAIISESVLTVTVPSEGKLLVQRGLERNTYDCSPACLPSVSLGDEEKHFTATINQATQRDGMAKQNGPTATVSAPPQKK